MPAPGSTRAPDKFKGNSSQLRDFLEEFEGHAVAQELTDDEKVRSILKYVDGMTRSYWKTLDGYEERDWVKMKTELFDAYPGAKKGHRYTVKGLLKLAESYAQKRIEEEADLIEYYRQF
ncbi:hypothetical protein GG344DRAFT_59937 [Lentinula edodes]|nr:hypothetical protein GG344DRAFT_59937 [Lentinula edodes]